MRLLEARMQLSAVATKHNKCRLRSALRLVHVEGPLGNGDIQLAIKIASRISVQFRDRTSKEPIPAWPHVAAPATISTVTSLNSYPEQVSHGVWQEDQQQARSERCDDGDKDDGDP